MYTHYACYIIFTYAGPDDGRGYVVHLLRDHPLGHGFGHGVRVRVVALQAASHVAQVVLGHLLAAVDHEPGVAGRLVHALLDRHLVRVRVRRRHVDHGLSKRKCTTVNLPS